MKPRKFIILLLVVFLLASSTNANAITTGKLYDLGYSYQLHPALDFSNPRTDFKGAYSHVTTNGTVIGQVEIQVPYNKNDEIVYFNFQLTDGSVHKGSYQCLGRTQYVLNLDGTNYAGNYTYTGLAPILQWMGLYDVNYIYVLYACKLSDKTQTAVYVMTQSYGITGPTIDAKAVTLLLPLSSSGVAMKSFSASSNYQCKIQCAESNQAELINWIEGERGVPGAWANTNNSSALSPYIDLINNFVGTLITVATVMIQLVLLLFMIGGFLFDPYNLILIIILFEEFAAITALSGNQDIFRSMGKFAAFNERMFGFIIMVANGLISVISTTIQALSVVVQTGAQVAQAGATAISGVVSWLVTLIAFLPK